MTEIRESMWIDGDGMSTVGTVGFLVECLDERGKRWHELRQHPPRTLTARKPRPVGRCGGAYGVYETGHGVWEVTKEAANGRLAVAKVTDPAALERWLAEVGYPELLPEILDAFAEPTGATKA